MNETNENSNVYFTFALGNVSYAINVKSVQEVLTHEEITPVPRTASYMKGVMNIRGAVVSIVDFRDLFGIGLENPSSSSSIVVVETGSDKTEKFVFGFIADSVNGVSTVDTESDKSYIDSGLASINSDFVDTIGRSADKFVLILDIEKIIQYLEADIAEKAKTM